jgi:hypothetical protein
MTPSKRTPWSKSTCLVILFLVMLSSAVDAKNFKIKIGPKAKDLTDEQTGQSVKQTSISKKGKDAVHWDSHKKGRNIYLEFHVPKDCAPPFSALSDLNKTDGHGNELFRLGTTTTDQLDSGTVAEGCQCVCDLAPSQCEAVDPQHPKRWQIKYDQYLQDASGQFEKYDGWIIVKP